MTDATQHLIYVDKANDLLFDTPGDDVSADVAKQAEAIIVSTGIGIGQLPFPAPSEASYSLANPDGTYDPRGEIGALHLETGYPDDLLIEAGDRLLILQDDAMVKRGRLTRIDAVDTGTILIEPFRDPLLPVIQDIVGVDDLLLEDGNRLVCRNGHPLFTGRLLTPRYTLDLHDPALRLRAIDSLTDLVGIKITTPLFTTSATVDQAIGEILDQAGWPDDGLTAAFSQTRSIESGRSLAYWWLADEDAFQALIALMNTEGPEAFAYVDGKGRFVFRSQTFGGGYHSDNPRASSAQHTLRDYGADPIYQEIVDYDDGLDRVINQAKVLHRQRTQQAGATLWTLGGTVSLAVGQSKDFVAKLANPANVTLFTGTLDSGTGPVSFGGFSQTHGDFAGNASGQHVNVRVTNSGPDAAVVSNVHIDGQLHTITAETVRPNTTDASASITEHGTRPLAVTLRSEFDAVDDAQTVANAWVTYYQNGRARITFRIGVGADGRNAAILRKTLPGDRLRIIKTNNPLPMDQQWWVQSMRHEARGGMHWATVVAEKVS